ncbi:MAG: YciI family protein [Kibdelosporangium sp.]
MAKMRYMLLIYGCNRDDLQSYEQVNAYVKEMMAQGVLQAADPLHLPDTATTVRVREDETLITDGPFAETHEALGGYFILTCADLDEAISWAAKCPMARQGSVEIRPILEVAFG